MKWNCVTFKDRSELPVSCICVCVCMRVFEQIAHQLYERRQLFVSAVYPDRLYTQTISPVTMGANFCLVFLPMYHLRNTQLTHLDAEGTNDIVSKGLLVGDGDLKGAKFLTSRLGPVLMALDFVPLSQVGHHDDGGRPFLPHQPPEVHIGLGQWTYRQW